MNYSGIYSSKHVPCKQTKTSSNRAPRVGKQMGIWNSCVLYEWKEQEHGVICLYAWKVFFYSTWTRVLWFMCVSVCACSPHTCLSTLAHLMDEGWWKTLCSVCPNIDLIVVIRQSLLCLGDQINLSLSCLLGENSASLTEEDSMRLIWECFLSAGPT